MGFTSRKIESSTLPVQLLWQTKLAADVAHQPLFSKHLAIVLTTRGVSALDLTSGELVWQYPMPRQLYDASIVVYEEMVFVGHDKGYVTAIHVDSGKIAWEAKIGGNYSRFVGNIVADADLVFAVTQPTYLEARNIKTGELKWGVNGFDAGVDDKGAQLLMSSGTLFLSVTKTYAVNKSNGDLAEVNQRSMDNAQEINGRFYLSNAVRDAKSLELLYRIRPNNCSGFKLPFAANQDDLFGVSHCGGVARFDRKGKIIWEYRTDLDAEAPIADFKGALFALFMNGEIHAIRIDNGQNQGVLVTNSGLSGYVMGAEFNSRGMTTNGSVLLATFNDRNVWAFE